MFTRDERACQRRVLLIPTPQLQQLSSIFSLGARLTVQVMSNNGHRVVALSGSAHSTE